VMDSAPSAIGPRRRRLQHIAGRESFTITGHAPRAAMLGWQSRTCPPDPSECWAVRTTAPVGGLRHSDRKRGLGFAGFPAYLFWSSRRSPGFGLEPYVRV